MKIALINGSPKFNNSASSVILNDINEFLIDNETIDLTFNKLSLDTDTLEKLHSSDILVIAFPLYVDGVPGHLLRYLQTIEEYFKDKKKHCTVYTIVNSGFYEAHQNQYALDIIHNWCDACNFTYGQGLGVGAGGMMSFIKNVPNGKGPKKNLSIAYQALSQNILNCTCGDNLFVSPSFPRFLYKASAEMGWRKIIKSNGLKARDIYTRKG